MTLKRYDSPGGYVDGEYVHGTPTVSTFRGTFQPATGEDTQIDIGGRRRSNVDMIYTSTQLFSTKNKVGEPSDIVEFGGKVFEVKRVAYWGNGILPHYEAQVEEQKEGTSR